MHAPVKTTRETQTARQCISKLRYHCELHLTKLCNEADHQREKEQKEESQGGLQQEQYRKVKPHAKGIGMTQNESVRLRGNGEQRQTTQVDPRVA
jgi:hypothetical protein